MLSSIFGEPVIYTMALPTMTFRHNADKIYLETEYLLIVSKGISISAPKLCSQFRSTDKLTINIPCWPRFQGLYRLARLRSGYRRKLPMRRRRRS